MGQTYERKEEHKKSIYYHQRDLKNLHTHENVKNNLEK